MATASNKPEASTGKSSEATQPQAESSSNAKQTRKKSALPARSQFLLHSLRQARRGCQLLAEKIKAGGEVSNEVATAAALLTGEASKCLD